MSHTNRSSPILITRSRPRNEESEDLISKLPDEILTNILSKLHIDEAVRCNVLSKRWEGLWKQTSHIEFDAKHMIMPMTQLLHSRALFPPSSSVLSQSMHKGVNRYGFFILKLICRHSGDISSCRFVHFKKSLSIGEVGPWVDLLVKRKKGLKDLSLECLPDFGDTSELEICKLHFRCGVFDCLGSLELINYTIDCGYAFANCKKLKTLKLKRIHFDDETLSGILTNCGALERFSLIECTGFRRLIIRKSKLIVLQLHALWVDEIEISTENLDVLSLDSTHCPMQNVNIYAPCIRTFRSCNYYILFARLSLFEEERSILRTHEVLSHWGDNLLVQNPIFNIFQKLSTLAMDLDLNCIQEAMELPFVLRLCINLHVLEISLPFSRHKNSDDSSSSGDRPLSYPMSMFWERLGPCNCIHQKLKFVYMRGFKGEVQEVEFAKYLITRATMMKKITIVCNDYSMGVAKNLLSLPRASLDLSINLTHFFNGHFAEH